MVELGTSLGRRALALHHHLLRHARAASVGSARGRDMKRSTVLINVALVIGAILVVFPLLWMLSVSFMERGAASAYPPPLLPAAPTLDNYRELFTRHAAGRYMLNSLFIATCATAIALV